MRLFEVCLVVGKTGSAVGSSWDLPFESSSSGCAGFRRGFGHYRELRSMTVIN